MKNELKVRIRIDNDPEKGVYTDYYHIINKIPSDEYCGLKVRNKKLMNNKIIEGDKNYYYWRVITYNPNSWDDTMDDYNEEYEFALAIRKED